jgi:very-short-patch-repair endonuclease
MERQRKMVKTTIARQLRRTETRAEQVLWSWLRARRLGSAKFRRQEPIGNYIVDFVCFDRKLIIEVDGAHHSDTDIAENDVVRTQWLESQGLRVLRFSNGDILDNAGAVIAQIAKALESTSPTDMTPP